MARDAITFYQYLFKEKQKERTIIIAKNLDYNLKINFYEIIPKHRQYIGKFNMRDSMPIYLFTKQKMK